MNYKDLCISGNISIRDAMRIIDKIAKKIVFIVEEGILRASLTDGDVRRYLLKGGNLDDKAILAGNKTPRFAYNKEEAKKLYHEKNFIEIPIVNKENKIIDVFPDIRDNNEIYKNLNIPVVINAGGKGTRLYPYTKVLPKPLIPVGEIPIIEHIMLEFMKFGCTNFHIIVNHKKELIKAYFNDNEKNYNIEWYDEEKPLGTGGGLSLLKGKINETFFFTNCDTLTRSNYESILRYHRDSKNAITMICSYKNIIIPYGTVEMGKNGSIIKMKEKPELSFLINTGMYLVEPDVLYDIKDDTPIGFPDILEEQKTNNKKVSIYPVSEDEWLDMGQLPELEKMRCKLYGE